MPPTPTSDTPDNRTPVWLSQPTNRSDTMTPNRHPTTGVRYTIYHINNDLHPEV